MTDDQEDEWFEKAAKDSPEYLREFKLILSDEFNAYEKAFTCDPRTGYELVGALKEVGYDPGKDGFVAHWLFDYLGEWLKTAPMEEDGDAFPQLEATNPSDKTIGRDPLPGEPHYVG